MEGFAFHPCLACRGKSPQDTAGIGGGVVAGSSGVLARRLPLEVGSSAIALVVKDFSEDFAAGTVKGERLRRRRRCRSGQVVRRYIFALEAGP